MTKRTFWLVILLFITNICSAAVKDFDWSNTKYKNVDEWIAFGKKHLRRTYRNGGVGPYAFDCSGFTMYMYKELGYALPHSSSAQSDYGEKIKANNVQPGDLVFFAGSKGSSIGHVGIVIEATDDDFSFIHASLKQGICIDKSTHQYYKSRYKTARRIFDLTADNRKNAKKEVSPIPVPQPVEEEVLELPDNPNGMVDNGKAEDRIVDNNSVIKKKVAPKKKESRRERRKREKAEKERLEKEKAKKKNDALKKSEPKKVEPAKKTTPKNEPKKDDKKQVAKKTHIVEKGETMYRISKMAGLTVDELKEINGLSSNDLKVGQVLIIEK